jgi:hypothetical protein
MPEVIDGLRNRPETTDGTVDSDVLAHFVPGFRRPTTVESILGSPWPIRSDNLPLPTGMSREGLQHASDDRARP